MKRRAKEVFDEVMSGKFSDITVMPRISSHNDFLENWQINLGNKVYLLILIPTSAIPGIISRFISCRTVI